MSDTRPEAVQEAMKQIGLTDPYPTTYQAAVAAYIRELETTLNLRDTYLDDRDAEIATLKAERDRLEQSTWKGLLIERVGNIFSDLKNRRIEKLEAENERLKKHIDEHYTEAATKYIKELELENGRLKTRNAELEDLFTLQHTRTVEAVNLWRKAHPGNDLVMPDLGELLTWLMGELEKAGRGRG